MCMRAWGRYIVVWVLSVSLVSVSLVLLTHSMALEIAVSVHEQLRCVG